MESRCRSLCLLFIGLASPPFSVGETIDQILDDWGDRLTFASESGYLRARLSAILDLEWYVFERPPPGQIWTQDSQIWQPRGTLFLDVQAGANLYAFAQARVDRGFDPWDGGWEARLDEFAIRWSPWSEGRLNLQAGQFATVIGQWVLRHLSWENPFVTAPLFYENRTPFSDVRYPGGSPPPDYGAPAPQWWRGNPIIWGPAYTSGFAASGRFSSFEWAVELKNAALMSRPSYWAWWDVNMSEPTVAARVAWTPDPRWTLGLSASQGAFLGPSADYAIPAGRDRGDYKQTVWLLDVSYAHRHWQFWAEAVHADYRGPGLYPASSWAYFLESRYKFTPRLSGAVRWNQQFFSDMGYYAGVGGAPTDQTGRLDVAATWRFNAHSQIQLEVGRRHGGSPADRGRLSLATRLTVRF